MPGHLRCKTRTTLRNVPLSDGSDKYVTAVAVCGVETLAVALGPAPTAFPPAASAVDGTTTVRFLPVAEPAATRQRRVAGRLLPPELQSGPDDRPAVALPAARVGAVWSFAPDSLGRGVIFTLPYSRAVGAVTRAGEFGMWSGTASHHVEPTTASTVRTTAVVPPAPTLPPGARLLLDAVIALGTVESGVLVAHALLYCAPSSAAAFAVVPFRCFPTGGAPGEFPCLHVACGSRDVAATSWASPACLLWSLADAAAPDILDKRVIRAQAPLVAGDDGLFYSGPTAVSVMVRGVAKNKPIVQKVQCTALGSCSVILPEATRTSARDDGPFAVVAVGTAGEVQLFGAWSEGAKFQLLDKLVLPETEEDEGGALAGSTVRMVSITAALEGSPRSPVVLVAGCAHTVNGRVAAFSVRVTITPPASWGKRPRGDSDESESSESE